MNKISHLLILFSLSALLFSSCKKEIEGFGPGSPNLPVNYGLQSSPDIGTFMPPELLSVMAPYLHFGDTPPKIDTCFHAPTYDVEHVIYHTSQLITNPQQPLSFRFKNQHGCSIDSIQFKIPTSIEPYLWEVYANSKSDNVYIMGHDTYFTAYYQLNLKLNVWVNPDVLDNPSYASVAPLLKQIQELNGKELVENIILSGTAINDYVPEYVFTKWNKEVIRTSSYSVDNDNFVTLEQETIKKTDVRYLDTLSIPRVKGIEDIKMGVRIENNVPQILPFSQYDVLLYSYPETLIIDTEFYEGENRYRP